jgi:hypothetical protein
LPLLRVEATLRPDRDRQTDGSSRPALNPRPSSRPAPESAGGRTNTHGHRNMTCRWASITPVTFRKAGHVMSRRNTEVAIQCTGADYV